MKKKRIKLPWDLKKEKRDSAAPAGAVLPATPVPVILCTSLEDITFASWIKCVCDQNYSSLIVSGKPSEFELHQAWFYLLSEYYQLTGSRDAEKYIRLISKVEAYNTKVTQVELLVAALRLQYNEKLCDLLRLWKYNLPFTKATLTADLNKVIAVLGNDKLRLEKARLDYDKSEQNKKGHPQKATKENYMKMLYAIEKHRQMILPPETLSVYKFCILYKELEEYNDFLTKKQK